MLHHRSFKSAKCKTALKLVVSRIKVLKNRREAHMKQLRSEMAQLLHSGHNHTARIRVEHVFMEEKRMAAYDLIEIYCELIAARLKIIESHKHCPFDLKEAIASVIFASPRCSEIPELMDVRKHIMAKYGKEFVTAAVELRPDCGVNRSLVEKLSAVAPDAATKTKILSAIAEEYNIELQTKSLEKNDVNSSKNLPAGANIFEKATYVEPPQLHVPPNLRDSYQFNEINDVSTNSCEQNRNFAATKAGGNQSITSGSGKQEMEFRNSYHENKNAFPMEFKDAASAAHAAAESAERASMAARAAAQLSNREKLTRHYSTGFHCSSSSRLSGEIENDEMPQEYAFHVDKYLSSGSVTNTFQRSMIEKEETSKSIKCDGDIPSKEKECHVHPKLPDDYDSFLAHFMSLKKNN